ncbi:MAG: molecular chaperone TorD family protein [Coriobacteriales bacterium]|nr:molecular chaperone TorD family protein [Coriobacteriales bacterium]
MSITPTWQMKATIWELLAVSLRYPDDTLAQALASGDWTQAALEIAGALNLSLPEEFTTYAQEAQELAKGEDGLDILRGEATRMFISPYKPACSGYETMWRAEDDGVKPLLFVNKHAMAVERFYRSCGLKGAEGTNDPLDHIGSECEFMQFLACLAAGAQRPEGVPADEDFPGGSPAAAYYAFKSQHIDKWVPRFSAKMLKESRTPFFKATSILLTAWLEADSE